MENRKGKREVCDYIVIIMTCMTMIGCVHKNVIREKSNVTEIEDSTNTIENKWTIKDTVSKDSLVRYVTEDFEIVRDGSGNIGTYLKKRTTMEREAKERKKSVSTIISKCNTKKNIDKKSNQTIKHKEITKDDSIGISRYIIVIGFILMAVAAATFLYVRYRKSS